MSPQLRWVLFMALVLIAGAAIVEFVIWRSNVANRRQNEQMQKSASRALRQEMAAKDATR